MKTDFFEYLDFALQFAPAGAGGEVAIRAKLARIGIGAGKNFDFKDLSPEHKAAVVEGMKAGEAKIEHALSHLGTKSINGWNIGSPFGVPRLLQRRLADARRRRQGGHLRQRRRSRPCIR